MKILDSGKRTDFETGAVRDGQEGKGRMDLLPMRALREVAITNLVGLFNNPKLEALIAMEEFMIQGVNEVFLEAICWHLLCELEKLLSDPNIPISHCYPLPGLAVVEVSKVFEAGALKYEERNWEKGIPLSRYLDSGMRHFFKYVAGKTEEPHLVMACWNFLCLLDTILRIREGVLPETLNNLPFLDLGENK